MSVNVPETVWRVTSGNGELATGQESLTTLSGDQLTTLGGLSLVSLEGTYTSTPATEWDIVDDIPVSIWRPTDGNSEFSSEGISDIVDASGDSLVDPSGDQIVDTGVVETNIQATDWEENDSV